MLDYFAAHGPSLPSRWWRAACTRRPFRLALRAGVICSAELPATVAAIRYLVPEHRLWRRSRWPAPPTQAFAGVDHVGEGSLPDCPLRQSASRCSPRSAAFAGFSGTDAHCVTNRSSRGLVRRTRLTACCCWPACARRNWRLRPPLHRGAAEPLASALRQRARADAAAAARGGGPTAVVCSIARRKDIAEASSVRLGPARRYERVAQVARSDAPVLLLGERAAARGRGRAIHPQSPRAERLSSAVTARDPANLSI